MLNLLLNNTQPIRILCLGAHSDDIEIGCGGTLLHLFEQYRIEEVYWIVFSASQARKKEAEASAASFLKRVKKTTVETRNFRDGFFPFQGTEIKEYFEQLKQNISPNLVFTHYRQDRHQDHRLISDLTWNTFRNHLILEYETPKYDGDLGIPNLFVPLDDKTVAKKNELILNSFPSQSGKHWFDAETFNSLLRLRGMEAATKYAEAFYARKIVL